MGEEVVREIAEPPSYGKTECLLLLLLSSLINCSPEHNNVLRLQYTYQHHTVTDNNTEHIIMLVFQSSGVYIAWVHIKIHSGTSDIFLQLLFKNVLVKGFFLLRFFVPK